MGDTYLAKKLDKTAHFCVAERGAATELPSLNGLAFSSKAYFSKKGDRSEQESSNSYRRR